MAKKKYEESNIAAIAEAIRSKTGTSTTYTTSEMPNGVGEVYEAGKQAEHDRFWDNAIADNTKVSGVHTFAGSIWNDETFKPTKPIIITGMCNYTFYNNGSSDISSYVSFENITQMNNTFDWSKTKKIPYIDASKVGNLNATFASSQAEIIEGITVAESTSFSNSLKLF
jgi:hypothetical protein